MVTPSLSAAVLFVEWALKHIAIRDSSISGALFARFYGIVLLAWV
jgi:hypothetical protein